MKDKRNAYEIIGTNRDYIIRIHEEIDKDKFILEKKNDTMRRLKNEYNLLTEQFNQTKDEKAKLDLQKRMTKLKDKDIPLIERAYLEICNQESRQVYDDQLNLTIRIEGLKFEIEYNYEDLISSKYSNIDRHIIWKYLNLKLPLEYFTRSEKKLINDYINQNIYFKPDIETYNESIYKNPVKKIVDYNKEKKEVKYVQETEFQKMERQAKEKFEEQKYTYKIKGKKRVRKLHEEEKEKDKKPKTYIDQIEEQRNAVKSQILKHL